MKKNTSLLLVLFLQIIACNLFSQDNFYAYHTKVAHSSTDYYGKYADLIVVIKDGCQLEFTRRTQYQPVWVTPAGTFKIDEFIPSKNMDYNLEYTHVRLLEWGPEKMVVHLRYMPDLELIKKSIAELNSATIDGFTNVVHELFTIYPDGKIEREVKDARASRYETWIRPDYGDRQVIKLTDSGVEHGPVTWGDKGKKIAPLVDASPIKKTTGLEEPVLSWNFDEGASGIEDAEEYEDYEMDEIVDMVVESVSEEMSLIQGHMAVFKEGVSGTALGLDGYYSGIYFENEEFPEIDNRMTIEAWLALDVYPFNEAPIMHKSENFGERGFYFGVDPYGKLMLRMNGETIKSSKEIPLYTWTHVAATINEGAATIYINVEESGSVAVESTIDLEDADLVIGINTEPERCTDYVRDLDQNLPFIYGIQGLLDEVKVYKNAFSADQITRHYQAFLPENRISPLEKAVLPGEPGMANSFGASYKTLEHHELWDKMWRNPDKTDIVVKFDNNPASVVYWRGTNYAANWVTDNNRWMADQSSEIFTTHGCSEHMADKQTRHSNARIIENNPARVVIHWRYPCVDIGYICINRMNYTDEYHTIYPDGTAIRRVVYNNTTTEAPGFQDIQYFTNPGETALDVVDLNAVTVANMKGKTEEFIWEKPNKNPRSRLKDACIQHMNSKSEWKVYAIYPDEGIGTWGDFEQSAYTDDPFAGPWNHWPISLVPSDGRYAVAHDRVTHFALGVGNAEEEGMLHYGFSNQGIESTFNTARYWKNAPEIIDISGGTSKGFSMEEKAFLFEKGTEQRMSFTVNASSNSPVVNPAFVFYSCDSKTPEVKINGTLVERGKDLRVGTEYDTNGKTKTIIWIALESVEPLSIELDL